MNRVWISLLKCGAFLGCHQKPERSFFFRGKQFPVCARCTGIFVGNMLAMILYPMVGFKLIICAIFCIIMFLDWIIQYSGIKESTNLRRLFTGVLCGYGLLTIEINCFIQIIQLIFKVGK